MTGKITIKTTKQIDLFIIGETRTIEQTVKNVLAGDFQLYNVRGVFLTDKGEIALEYPVVSDPVKYVLENDIPEVLVAVEPSTIKKNVYEELNANGIGVNINIESVMGFQPEDQYIQNIGILKSISIGTFNFSPSQGIYMIIKRFVDIVAGLIGIILLIPATIIVKICYLLSGDTAKIIYRQKRVGKDGKIIRIWKFRSMIPNADAVLKEMLKEDVWRKQWEENQKFENDPRITKVGRILRKTSIDELPQLMNVLIGDMSLVGPRPLVKGELEAHGGMKLYQKVRPGITGWWGCNGRSNIDYKERLDLEYYYVKNCSLYLDLLTLFRTFLAVLKKDGAQ